MEHASDTKIWEGKMGGLEVRTSLSYEASSRPVSNNKDGQWNITENTGLLEYGILIIFRK